MTLNPESIAAIERKISVQREEKRAASSKFGLLLLAGILSLFMILSVFFFIYFGTQVKSLKKRAKAIEKVFPSIEKEGSGFLPLLGNLSMPRELQTTPLAEKTGLILEKKTISVRNVAAPYNPSFVEYEGGYLLFFRYDAIQQEHPFNFYSYIGCCELDANFEQTEKEFRTIDTGSPFSEDARVFRVGEELFLLFNDLVRSNSDGRAMHIGKLNLKESKLDYNTILDLQLSHVEKNWVPFEHIENGKPEIYFEYYPNPQKILKLLNPETNSLLHLSFPETPTYHKFFWNKIYGRPRGGAAAKIVDDQYLSFFHSFFLDDQKTPWYIMGAYTFEKEAPFRVTGVSHYPILFEGIYESPHLNTADPTKRVIFPSSFTEGVKNGKQVLYVFCGENDSCIKMITLDKQLLLKGLKKL